MGEKFPRILPKVVTSTSLLGSFTCRRIYDMGPTALLPLRRKACWGFFSPEKSDGFGRVWTRELGYHFRPPKPLICRLCWPINFRFVIQVRRSECITLHHLIMFLSISKYRSALVFVFVTCLQNVTFLASYIHYYVPLKYLFLSLVGVTIVKIRCVEKHAILYRWT